MASDKTAQSLDFTPNNHHPQLIQVLWQDVSLNTKAASSTVDMSELPLAQVLFDFYGPLTLMEIFQLFQKVEQIPSLQQHFDKKEFCQKQGRQWNQRLSDLFTKLEATPKSFQNWAINKQMDIKGLQPLLSLQDVSEFTPLLNTLADKNLTRNEGKQALDLLVDLFLMETPLEEILPTGNTPWLESLLQKRNPMAWAKQQEQKNDHWPRYVQVVNHRQGDRVLKKMQIVYSDAKDLQEKLQRLSKQGQEQ